MIKYKLRQTCRICNSNDLVCFLKFKDIPLAGRFIRPEEVINELIFSLTISFCKNCKEVQIMEVIPPDILFKDYRFMASTTKALSEHFIGYSKDIKKLLQSNKKSLPDSLVIEFGSNDGVLLKPLKDLGVRAVGVEPAENIAKIAQAKGVNVINDFFNKRTALQIIKEYGLADIITGNNVFAHIEDIHEVVDAIEILLKKDGIFMFEVHYLFDLLDKYQYDMIYHEHIFYHSLTSLTYLLNIHNMVIFNVVRVPTHCGSIRVYAKRKGTNSNSISKEVMDFLNLEKEKGIDRQQTFLEFANEVYRKINQFHDLIYNLKKEGKKIIGYGASGRASTHINFSKLGKDALDYIIDMSPERYGRLIPKMHIPIVSPEKIKDDQPDFAVIFAYNYSKEIIEKEQDFINNGGKFIIPLPEPKIIDTDILRV